MNKIKAIATTALIAAVTALSIVTMLSLANAMQWI